MKPWTSKWIFGALLFLFSSGSLFCPGLLWGAESESPAQVMDMTVSRIYVNDIRYSIEGLIEVEICVLVRDSALTPLRRAMIGIASSRPDKDLFYDLNGEPNRWLRTDYEGRVSFLMRTSVEGELRIGATVNEDQAISPLINYLYGYHPDPSPANLVSGKALELTLNRNDRLIIEGLAPHEEDLRRPFYGASHVTFYLNTDIMIQDGEMIRLDAVPVLSNGVTFLPLRATAQALGAMARWDVNLQTAVLTRGVQTLMIQNLSSEMIRYVDKNPDPIVIPIHPPAYLDAATGRIMTPLRAIADAFDAVVWYDQSSHSVHLTQQRSENDGIGITPS